MSEQQTSLARTNGRPHDVAAPTMPVNAPNVDIFENEHEYLVEADLPGASPDSISVHLDATQLVIDATRQSTEGFDGSSYRRTFSVPEQLIDADRIEAELKSGVLRVRLPKREDARPRRIAIKAVD